MTIFDYDKALAVVQSTPFAKDFLDKNRTRVSLRYSNADRGR